MPWLVRRKSRYNASLRPVTMHICSTFENRCLKPISLPYHPPVDIPSLQLHHAPPIPHGTRAQRRIRHPDIFRCGIGKRVAVARKIVRHAVRDNSQVFGEVQRRGDYEKGEEEKEYRVCRNC
jgi:hypothetical protein